MTRPDDTFDLGNQLAAARRGSIRAMLEIYGEDPDSRQGRYWLRRAAEAGSIVGERELADDLEMRGRWPEALTWFRRAAERGNAEYQNYLGEIYRDGERGVPVDKREAANWLRRSAEQGHPSGALSYGYALFYGRGVRRNRKAAKRWYEYAAEYIHVAERWSNRDTRYRAMSNLAIMHFYGQGVPRDITRAVYWWQRAARLLPKREVAVESLAVIYDGGAYDGRTPTTPNHALAVKWLRRGAAIGSSDCQWRLGYRYLCAKGVRFDDERGVALIREAAEVGDYEAQYLLGIMYREGEWVRRNRRVAESWFKKAGLADDPREARALEKLLA